MFQQSDVIWTHVVSDVLITASYFSIPVALLYFYRKRTDLAFNWIFVLFATFIFACGTTHIFQVIAIWEPLYRLEGFIKVITAIASVGTATVLWPLIPKALALPSPAMLREEIDERRKAEAALRQSHDELEQRVAERTAELEHLNRLKDEFLATLSHELRTPLNAILGWTHLLKRDPQNQKTAAEALDVIDRNARSQMRIVSDLLDMNRVVSGKLHLDVRLTDLAEIITSAVQVVRPAAEAKAIRIETDFGDHLRPVWGDPDRLQQMVWNLLSNAIKFTQHGGWMRVSLHVVQSKMEIRVADNGAGIAAEALPFIFEKFRQADQTISRRYGGLGLGLAIVRHLAELHGGFVHAQSDGPGKGATFIVRLPIMAVRRDALEPPQNAANETQPSTAADIDLSGMKVLVVDDEPDSAHVVQQLLSAHGATAMVANSVSAALQAFDEFNPDVIISDIAMPGEDGYDLIRQIRSRSNVAAIALTALARSDDVQHAMSAGFHAHMSKPVEPVQLALTVASFRSRTP